ncbi:hypothetical protein F5X68DRAFT_264831 [Plectosphaerella plurivora]|uniref:Uncharacterized protein n=1 Tax=Plectosphaerella plurivora TaxID=936078 RepID=A0A9P9A8A0_9PEZI|nr:hypothetical protein F5X68DRAFT_264831 [Plectosphaerella plurivora]
MADEIQTSPINHQPPVTASTSAPRPAIATATGTAGGLRRSATVDENTTRRRQRFESPSAAATAGDPFEGSRRRSSTFSEYSMHEAGGLFNPKPPGARPAAEDSSNWASIPLAFALLPAVGGVLFKNGSSVVTDIMLLGLAAIFLHWSVTQPWNWYHSAQEVRVQEELSAEIETEEDSEAEHHEGSVDLDAGRSQDEAADVPEETPVRAGRGTPRGDALAELYLHEVLALSACFLFPIMGAYLLHAIRTQLSRPSEGLVSNYNLTIFLLASELRPLSHLMTLVQARTLHLQRLVSENPDLTPPGQLSRLMERLEALEARPESSSPSRQRSGTPELYAAKQEHLVRDVRNVIQPELDALNRAVRRYEKKATLLSMQTESRFNSLDARLNDALSLAAAAAKHSTSPGFFQWAAESCMDAVMLPFKAFFSLILFPFRTILRLIQGKKLPERRSRSGRGSRSSNHVRSGGDRPPGRISRR